MHLDMIQGRFQVFPPTFARGSKITEKQMLAVSICFNKRYQSPLL